MDLDSSERVKCILRWIAFAKQPLRRLELLSAISFSDGDPEVNRLVPQYFLEDCAALLEERHDTTLGFIHVSLKEWANHLILFRA